MNHLFLTFADRPLTVAASAFIGILATYVALELAGRVHRANDRISGNLWVIVGSFVMGSGIWATHFIGMSTAAYPFRAGYEPGMTLVSWIVAVLASAVVMSAAGRARLGFAALGGFAVVAGCGATAMHYIGMQALVLHPDVVYFPGPVFAALVVMIIGTAVAMRLFFALRDLEGSRRVWRQFGAATLYGGTLTSMQYIAMAPIVVDANAVYRGNGGLDAQALACAVGIASVTFLTLMLLVTFLERRAEFRAKLLGGSLDVVREELRLVTFNDPVTGLPNRLVFQDRLKQAIARCDRAGESLAVLFVDLDGFKAVDHSWDGSEGEHTLQHVATALVGAARASDTVANIGGDQFLVIMDGVDGPQPAVQVAERLGAALRGTQAMGRDAIRVTASIGITLYPADGPSTALVTNASTAATAARHSGGNGYRFFESKMNIEAHAKSRWLDDLRGAVANQQLELHYQPKVHAQSGKIAGVEALLRWHHPTCGMVSPAVFIPLAEQFGLINELGSWVIDEACRQMRIWCDQGINMRVAINLSVHQLRQPGLADEITAKLASHRVDPALLTCEITESGAMDNTRATFAVFEHLQRIGIRLAIDDFGTGYSSLSYLRSLPVRQLKIDRTFVNDLDESDDARLIVAAIINLAHALRLEVVAEGVETNGQKDVLLALGCDKFQGYLFAKPMPAAMLTARATNRSARTDDFRASVFAVS